MCLIVFAYDCHPVYHLILGANRDEFRDRPTVSSRFWSDAPHLLAGRDKVAAGTWLTFVERTFNRSRMTSSTVRHSFLIRPPIL